MIAKIIPTKKLPGNLRALTYKVPAHLESSAKIGTIVHMPFRSSITKGVILSTSKKNSSPFKLKPITKILSSHPLFTSLQLELFSRLADYYFVSPSLFIHFNIPKLIKTDWEKIPNLPKDEAGKPSKPSYIWYASLSERNKKYKNLIKKNKGQLLFIVPRINNIQTLANELKLKQEQFITIHRKLSRKENINVWFEAMQKKSTVFIGTRSSVFYPFTNLKTIVIDDEHSIDHKQYDMNPRYEVSIATEFISKINGSKIIYSSASPSIVSYYQFKPTLKTTPNQNIYIANLSDELEQKNYSFISDKLILNIKKTIDSKKSVFLLVNKKGESSSVVCRDCGHSFECPTCHIPLTSSGDKFHCYHCDYSELMPPFCPHCAGPNFTSSGLGIEKVKNNLTKIITDQKIIKLDKTDITLHTTNSSPQIIIGTEFALDKINWKSIGHVGFINIDQLWHHLEYNSSEKAYALISHIFTLAPNSAIITIQTFSRDNPIISSITSNNPSVFYQNELKIRSSLNYPPFTNLVKLSYLNTSPEKAKKVAKKLFDKIHIFSKKTITINAPIPIIRKKIRGKFKYNIIIKLNNLDDFKPIRKLISNDWLIDIHPRTLLD